jgi:hypothetical protein
MPGLARSPEAGYVGASTRGIGTMPATHSPNGGGGMSGRACAEVGFLTMLFGADRNILTDVNCDVARQLDHSPRLLQ